MINKTILKIILIILFVSNLFFTAVAVEKEMNLRGKGGTTKSGGSVKIRISSNMLKINKFKKTFKKYYSQNEKEKIITDQAENVPVDIITVRGSGKKIYSDLKKSVFFIINPVAFEDKKKDEIIQGSTGTGSLIDDQGFIITNYHVIENANQVWIYPYSKEFNLEKSEKFLSTVVARNKTTDLAILKVYGISNKIKPIPFGTIDKMQEGDDVYAIGHPNSLHWSITDGIISNIRKNYEIEKFSLKADLIQNTAPILGGSSGGPLLNERGQIIGVNTVGDDSANFNFAVAINHVGELLKQVSESTEIKTLVEEELLKKYENVLSGDYNNNGIIDEWSVDTDNNGIYDALYVDDDEDGKIERIYIDANENKVWDMIVFDDDLDGNPNRQVIDEDEDGTPDLIAYDFNQDGKWDKFKPIEKNKN